MISTTGEERLVPFANTMNGLTPTITFHPSSLFHSPKESFDTIREPNPTVDHYDPVRERSHSNCSSSSIDTEFTHFRPIRRAPVTGKRVVIARPKPVRVTTVSSCSTLSLLRIEQIREEERSKQEKMDCELAWRIHKQEKRFMLRPTRTQTPTRNRSNQKQDEKRRPSGRNEVKGSKLEGKKRQGQSRRQQTARKCQLS